MYKLAEPMPEMFTRSKIVILDFEHITQDLPDSENIKTFFRVTATTGENPRKPQNRQKFNDQMLDLTGNRYLIGRYGEDRQAMLANTPAGKAGRTIHMALDIFSKSLEAVMAPCDGEIVVSDYEEGFGEYGNYLILKPSGENYYIFFGHLGLDSLKPGVVTRGQQIAYLGDCDENGGWSRHLHLQILNELPAKGTTPEGYSKKENFYANSLRYPNPLDYFSELRLQ